MSSQQSFLGVRLIGESADELWNVCCEQGLISQISEHDGKTSGTSDGRLLGPSLCHPHIHLDKCFLLSHPKYADLNIQKGDFAEAMELTKKAKSRFEHEDLLERGRALIQESINFGVTHMRAFVEVDPSVGMKCLDAGLAIKENFKSQCHVQICAFAQDPIFSSDDDGETMCNMLRAAAAREGVDVVGSTPYVEGKSENQVRNVNFMVHLAQSSGRLLDFHLDYNLDSASVPRIYDVMTSLEGNGWQQDQAVTLGHCTRLTLFGKDEWHDLRTKVGDLPISFVGLPTSDLFMMGRPEGTDGGGTRTRGTLQVPQMIQEYGFSAAIGVNNVGNAFTPQGSCDPLALATLGVGVYQAGTKEDAQTLYECVSSRARHSIGFQQQTSLKLKEGDAANFVVFGTTNHTDAGHFRHRITLQDLTYDATRERTTYFQGQQRHDRIRMFISLDEGRGMMAIFPKKSSLE